VTHVVLYHKSGILAFTSKFLKTQYITLQTLNTHSNNNMTHYITSNCTKKNKLITS